MPLYYQNPTPVQSAIFVPFSGNFNSPHPGESPIWTTSYDNIGITNNTSYIVLPIGNYQANFTLNFAGSSLTGAQIYIGIQVESALQYLRAQDIQNDTGGSISFSQSFTIASTGNFALNGYRANAAVTSAANLVATRSSISFIKLS